MGKRRIRKRRRSKRSENKQGRIKATLPGGRVVYTDESRAWPAGTMLVWNDETSGEMRWCVTGGGWPFDD